MNVLAHYGDFFGGIPIALLILCGLLLISVLVDMYLDKGQ